MIITVTLNPALDKTAFVDKVILNGLNRLDNIVYDVGGKGINVCKTLVSLKQECLALGFVGGYNGELIINRLNELGINHDFVFSSSNTRTNLKLIDKNNNLTEFNEAGFSISANQLNALLEKIEFHLKENDILVLSGSASKSIPDNIYETIINIANKHSSRVILDADGPLLKNGLKASPSLIKPNKFELCNFFNLDVNIDDELLINLSKKLLNDKLKLIVLSNSKDGAYFISKDIVYKADSLKLDVKSCVGAGDSMVAALAYGLSNNLSLPDLIKHSMSVASLSVSKDIGTLIDIKDLNNLMDKVTYYQIY